MVDHINLPNKEGQDQSSVASSITMGRSLEPGSNTIIEEAPGIRGASMTSSIKTMDQQYFAERFDKSLTLAE